MTPFLQYHTVLYGNCTYGTYLRYRTYMIVSFF
jgi:hypothetical protein